jgi:hypothetical protein
MSEIEMPGMQQVKSFWQRKEGKTGMFFLVALIGAVLYGAYYLLPIINKILQDAVQTAIYGGALAVILLILTNKKVHNLIGMSFRLIMRNITSWFVTIDPIGILKECLAKLDENMETFNKQLGIVKGVMVGLRRKIEKYLSEYKNYMDLANEAQKKNNAKAASSNAMFAQRRKDAAERLGKFHRKLEAIYRILSKMYENCGIIRDQTKDNIEMNEDEWESTKAAYKATRSAMSVINGNADDRALKEQALEFMAHDTDQKLGEMERFLEVSKGVLDGIDLQNDVYSEKGLKALEEWEKTSDSWVLGDQKKALLDAAADDSNILPLEGAPADNDYSKLFSGFNYNS